jgi:hypothetical protein
MENRELLELAAKAAGIKCRWWKVKQWEPRRNANGTKTKFYTGTNDVFGTHHAKPWTPLTDDGDALRLAVALRLDIDQYETDVIAWKDYIGTGFIPHSDDPCAATRRAIVMAAAEIGRAMP